MPVSFPFIVQKVELGCSDERFVVVYSANTTALKTVCMATRKNWFGWEIEFGSIILSEYHVHVYLFFKRAK